MRNKQLIILAFPILTAQAGNWLQAKLKYTQLINGRDYPAEVILLRPESYFTENKATKSGDQLTVNLPEMGLADVAMDIVSIESFKGVPIKEDGLTKYKQINEINWDNKTNRPVTGTFKRYAKEVYTYKFRNIKTGEVSTINATPNHPFYVVNKHDYVPISEIRAKDKLLSQTGEQVQLICTAPQTNCGTRYNPDNAPTLVYNFEVYQQHRYYIANKGSKQGLLVHNPCNSKITTIPGEHGPVNFTKKALKEYKEYMLNEEELIVYRGAGNSPDEILKYGFTAKQLVFGGLDMHSLNPTGGISTSIAPMVAFDFIGKDGGYIYEINLLKGQGIHNTWETLRRVHEYEYVVLGYIPKTQITGVVRALPPVNKLPLARVMPVPNYPPIPKLLKMLFMLRR